MSVKAHRLIPWFWFLLPANPILTRVVQGMSRRTRHLWLRFGYLAVLLGVVTILLLADASDAGTLSLADLAKGASKAFKYVSLTQLVLMCFLAPVFTAGAITQERDSETYNILLTTPLSNAQIVIGSLCSRLYFVIVLLLAGLPIFLATMLYGGVTLGQVVRSFSIAGSTAVLTGSLAIAISVARAGTRRTIFSFFIGIAAYLLIVGALGLYLPGTWVDEAPADIASNRKMSWLAAVHPVLALEVALNQVTPPEPEAVAHRAALLRYVAAYPPQVYVVFTLLTSVLLTMLAMLFVRRGARLGEETAWTRLVEKVSPRCAVGGLTRQPHQVWSNPVAWREAVTRASATNRSLGRYLVIGGGLAAAGVLLYTYLGDAEVTASMARRWVSVLVSIEFAIVLVIATNTAASSLTKDKESSTLDIMLTTPLTSGYIIWGKLRGLVSFVMPLIAVPVLSLLVFAVVEEVRRPDERVVYPETALEVGGLMTVFAAYACMIGMNFSLKQKKTVRAVVLAVGTLIMANLVAYLFWSRIVANAAVIGAGLAAATPFTALDTLIDPSALFESNRAYLDRISALRIAAFIGTLICLALHAGIVYSWYHNLVRSFDMIIRKQSAQ